MDKEDKGTEGLIMERGKKSSMKDARFHGIEDKGEWEGGKSKKHYVFGPYPTTLIASATDGTGDSGGYVNDSMPNRLYFESRKLRALVHEAAEEAKKIKDKIERYKIRKAAVSNLNHLVKIAEMERTVMEKNNRVKGAYHESIGGVKEDAHNTKRIQSSAVSRQIGRPIKNFSSFDESIFPIRRVDGNYIFSCPNVGCKKTFPSISRAKRHYIIHTGLRPFKCPNKDCVKMFSRKDNMLQHFRVHCKYTKKKSGD